MKDDGAFYTGWLQLTPTWTLYCDPADHGAVLTGFQTIENNRYYFDANGILMTGFLKLEESSIVPIKREFCILAERR